MELRKSQVDQILKTLPISYYAFRKIQVTLTDDDTSYYSPTVDEIHISFTQLQQACKSLSEDENLESNIRCLLYHEISHAIMTPTKLDITDVVNVFEDERIETIFADYYHDTDFKAFCKLVNHYDGKITATTAFQLYYQIVRFRQGPRQFTEQVNSIIDSYKDLTRQSSHYLATRYTNRIYQFYNDIVRYFNSEQYTAYKNSLEKNDDTSSCIINDKLSNTDTDSTDDIDDTLTPKDDADTINDIVNAKSTIRRPMSDTMRTLAIRESLREMQSAALDEKLKIILQSYNSATHHNGSAINAYSGVFNPRSVIRDDYKYFVQQNRLGHVKQFSKLHLNLFIDCSGSFIRSDGCINTLLHSLIKIERQSTDFSFDMVACGMGQKILEKSKRIQSSEGGNMLTNDIYEQVRKLQLPGTTNINIVCFDGYACSDTNAANPSNVQETRFKAFDKDNCVIISSVDNEYAIKNANVTHAKVIYTNNYSTELINNVLLALKRLLK